MAAYIMVEIEIEDPVVYARYRELVPGTLGAYGGRFLVRGGKAEGLEGGWEPGRMVVVEFPSLERAKAWWASPEYAEAKALRQRSAKTRMLVVQGVG